MPTCRGEYKTYYRGDEPSPKGLGWCARSEEVGKRRRGNDGEMWVVREDRIGRLSWKRTSTSSSSSSSGTPGRRSTKKATCKKNVKGYKIPFDMCTKYDGAQLKEYISRYLVQALIPIPYLDYTLNWCTGREYLLVQARKKTHVFKFLLDEAKVKGQESNTVLRMVSADCVQLTTRQPYQSIRTLASSAPGLLVDMFAEIIKELRAGKESFHNPNRDAVITLTTQGFDQGHLYFNLSPIPNAPPHVDYRFAPIEVKIEAPDDFGFKTAVMPDDLKSYYDDEY